MAASSRIKGQRKRSKRARSVSPENWSPYTVREYVAAPKVSLAAVRAILENCKIPADKVSVVQERLRGIAGVYWFKRRHRERPSKAWYRKHIKPVRDATANLLSSIREHSVGTALFILDEKTIGRPLRGLQDKPKRESIEQILDRLRKACDNRLNVEDSGARRYADVQVAAKELCILWEELTGKKVPLNLETELDRLRQEFVSPGSRFVHHMLEQIDPRVQRAQIETGLREALGKPRVRKSRPR